MGAMVEDFNPMKYYENTLLHNLLKLELSYDQNSHLNTNESIDSRVSEILYYAKLGNLTRVLENCEHLFCDSKNEYLLQIFAIQWAVAATEVNYNIELRTNWINRWSEIKNWKQNYWAQYIYNYQKALGYFFDGALYESEVYFKLCLDISKTENYSRGLYRTLFHLGLIERDRINYSKSQEYLEQALIVAENNKSNQMINKIKLELKNLKTTRSYHSDIDRILRFISEGKTREIRHFVRKLLKLRSWEGINREKNSDDMLLSIFLFYSHKLKSFEVITNRISDPVIKYQIYKICLQIRTLPYQFLLEFDLLKKYIESNKMQTNNDITNNVDTTQYSLEPSKLLLLLKNHPTGLTKEEIARILWKQSYDPFYHDSKIYKLVLKCRKEANNPKILINQYGIYKYGC